MLIKRIFLSWIICTSVSFAETLPTPVGRVVWVKGMFKALMDNKEERILQKKSVIYLHDQLITDTNSQGQIVFTDQTMMTLRSNSKFNIDQYHFEPEDKSSGNYVMNLVKGGFRTITGLIAKNNPNKYQVNTPVATIGVRGTEYIVYVDKGELFAGHYSGSPCVLKQTGSDTGNKTKKDIGMCVDGKMHFNTKHPAEGKSCLCLSEKMKYAHVPYAGADPQILTTRPAVFDEEDLPITRASAPSFPTKTKTIIKRVPSSGVVNSFCIQ